MATQIIDRTRQAASRLAYRVNTYDHLNVDDDLKAIAPHLSPADRTARLAELADAIAVRDAVTRCRRAEYHEAAERLDAVDVRLLPPAARMAWVEYAAAARLRRGIYLRDHEVFEGQDECVDHALEFWRQVQDGDVPCSEVEPELAHPDVLAERAEELLVEALGDLMFRAVARMDAAMERVEAPVLAQVESAFAALIGGAR